MTAQAFKPSVVLRGIAALVDALDCIGDEDQGDAGMAKIVCDNELEIRCAVRFALAHINERGSF